MQGRSAIDAIVRKFERPADPGKEIAGAVDWYGSGAMVGGSPVPKGNPGTTSSGITGGLSPDDDFKSQAFSYFLTRSREAARGEAPSGSIIDLAMQRKQAQAASKLFDNQQGAPSVGPAPSHLGQGAGLNELFYDPLGAIKNGQNIAPIGGHSDHVHISPGTAAGMRQAIAEARAMGLRVSENPLVDRVDPVHTKNSYHYRRYPGHPRVGEALDVSGSAAAMARYYRWAARYYRR
jgi:hypothetical protein